MPITIFEGCTFESNDLGLTWCQFDSRVSNCTFVNNTDGLFGIALVENSTFTGHSGIALSPYGVTRGCSIYGNAIGVSCPFNSVNNAFVDNQVYDNGVGVEIETFFPGIQFQGNTICQNNTYDIQLNHFNNANLANNCWCDQDSALIQSKIYDVHEDVNKGLVDFLPTAPNCAPLSISGSTDVLSSVSIFPNPFTDELTIETRYFGQSELTIYDLSSRVMEQLSFSGSTTLRLSELPSGMYLYVLRTADGGYTQGKIVRQ